VGNWWEPGGNQVGARWESGGSQVGIRWEPGDSKVCKVLTKCLNGTKLYSFDIFVKTGQFCTV
jgi:hypothetical protein